MTSLKFSRGSAPLTTAAEAPRVFHVSVVGNTGAECLPTSEHPSGSSHHHRSSAGSDLYRSHEFATSEAGSGKSCLCNRFVRPAEDDYLPAQEHVSVLSVADYSSAAINNDHFLYWGEAKRTSDDGQDCVFSIIEQTEFIDDSNFQPFRSGRSDKDYLKRATNIKVHSPGKIQYYGRSQLGIENEFPMHPMPDGRFAVDGFVCTFDLSSSSKKPLQRQVDHVFQLLCQIVRQKKPVVLVATKADDGNASYLIEANKLLHRKELKGSVQLVETSAHRNVNVDAAFMLLGQLIERTSGHTTQLIRYRLFPYADSAVMRKERMETAAKAFEALIRTQVRERKITWQEASRKFQDDQDFKFYCELWGTASAKQLFSNFMRLLRDREAKSRLSIYLSRLDRIFRELLTDLALVNKGWSTCLEHIQSLDEFPSYFADLPSGMAVSLSDATNFLDDDGFYDSGDTSRVPSRILHTADAERCFLAYTEAMRREEKQRRLRQQFVDLLNITPYALPGRTFHDLCIFLSTEPAYTEELNDLNVLDKQELYEAHQRVITEDAKEAFLELLMENVGLFQQKLESRPAAAVTKKTRKRDFDSRGKIEEDALSEIRYVLRSDRRYRAMDLLAQQQDLMLRKMWMYFQALFPEACSVRTGCFDTAVKSWIGRAIPMPENLPAFIQSPLELTGSARLNIILLGSNDLAENFHKIIRTACGEDDELRLDGGVVAIDFRIINGDLSQPQNAFQTPIYLPHGCFCIYDSKETFHYLRTSMERSLLHAAISEDATIEPIYQNGGCLTPCNGLPTVLVFGPRADFKESEVQRLRECGQDLAGNLQCAFLELTRVVHTSTGEKRVTGSLTPSPHKEEVVLNHLKQLARDIQARSNLARCIADGLNLSDLFDCDMKLQFCVACGDNQSDFLQHIFEPLISHPIAYRTAKNPQSFIVETYLSDDAKSRVEIDCKSYHESLRLLNPNSVPDDESIKKVDGYVFVVAVRRKASYRNMRCLMDMLVTHHQSRPCCLVLGVVEATDGPVVDDSGLLNEIEHLCEERKVIFVVTNTADIMSVTTFTPFLRLCWDQKISSYDRASTATLNSTVPSLSDEEAVLIKSRSLEREAQRKPVVLPRHRTFVVQKPGVVFDNFTVDTGSEDSPTFGTFGFGSGRPRARTETNSSDDLIAPVSRLVLEESTQLRATRSTEDILAYPNGHAIPASGGPSSAGEKTELLPESDLLQIRANHCRTRTHRKSVPSELDDIVSTLGTFHRTTLKSAQSSDVLRPWSATGRLHSKLVACSSSPRKIFSRSSSALNVASPSTDESKRGFHPFMRGLVAWQARSTDEGSEKSAGQRLVGKLTSGGRYTTFIDQLNANMARGSQQSPTAPLAIPELVEEREHDSTHSLEMWNGSASSLKSPANDRQFLLGLKSKKPRVPDRYGFRRVVPPVAPIVPGHHLSASQEDSIEAFPTRASLPELGNKPCLMKLHTLMSPLEDNVFFSSSIDEDLKNGIKPIKASKPKREKENKSSVKKGKDKKKKAEPTFEHFVQSPDNPIPLFIEKCIKFIEAKGIDTEGIYRVSGSRVHADQLLSKFVSHPSSVDLTAMDVPIYNVTTALKTYMTDYTPPVIPQSIVDELHELSFVTDKNERIQMIKSALAHLSATHFQLLKYMFAHLRRISENSRKNKMDVNNLTVCLWPTLCPIELPNDMARFEGIRVEVSEIISALITDYDKIFEPHSSPTATLALGLISTAAPLGVLAQEAAEAVRQRTTRHTTTAGAGGTTTNGTTVSSSPPSSASGGDKSSSNATSSSSLNVKTSTLTGLKSVQV